MRSRNGVEISVGDRIIWQTGEYSGLVVGILRAKVSVNWDHRSDDNPGLHPGRNLVKITESALEEFANEQRNQNELGRLFCDRFNLDDRVLRRMMCPVAAARLILDNYVGNVSA